MAKSKEQILSEISRAESALSNKGLTEGAKANIKKILEGLQKDLASMEKEVEKKEEKIEKKEEESLEALDEQIRKAEEQLKRNPPAAIKAVFEKKLKEAKEKRTKIVGEAKEDKAEAKQELKEVKEAVADLKKAVNSGRTAPIKKPKIKEKAREEKSKKRVKSMTETMSTLEGLVERVQALRDKYKNQGVDLKRDAGRPAKPFGYRFRGNDYRVPTPRQIEQGKIDGTIDYEARPNRSDKYPKGYQGNVKEKLARGGELMEKMSKGGKAHKGEDVSTSLYDKEAIDFCIALEESNLLAKDTHKNEKMIASIKSIVSASKKDIDKLKNDKVSMIYYEYKDWVQTYKMADGGMMAKGGLTMAKGGRARMEYDVPGMEGGKKMAKGDMEFSDIEVFDESGKKIMADGGEIEKPSMKKKGDKWVVVYKGESKEFDDKEDASEYMNDLKDEVKDKQWSKKINKGLGFAKGGKTKTKAKGLTKTGAMRKNSKHRFCWTKEAVKDGIIKKSQLQDTPSEFMRKKYPAYITEK